MTLLSVVLCTWNNADRLGITLDAISRCSTLELEWELLVVANACTDHTVEVVNQFVGSLPLRLVEEPQQGLSHARNAGVRAAAGGLIVFTDDDVIPDEQWLSAYADAYGRHPGGFFFGGPVTSEFEEPPSEPEILKIAPWSVRGLSFGSSASILRDDQRFLAANWACPHASLEQAGMFDPDLGLVGAKASSSMTGEESDLMERLRGSGLRALYLPEAHLRHFVPADKVKARHLVLRGRAIGRFRAEEAVRRTNSRLQRVALGWRASVRMVRTTSALALACFTRRPTLARRYRHAVALGRFHGTWRSMAGRGHRDSG